jgi:hypothetical protein
VAARLIAALAGVHCALFRSDWVFFRSFSHNFLDTHGKQLVHASGIKIKDSHASSQAGKDSFSTTLQIQARASRPVGGRKLRRRSRRRE